MRFVDNNNDQAGKDATTFMLVKGYNHLVFAYTDMDELVQTERYQGYCEALQEYDKKGSALQLSRLSDEENAVKLQTFLLKILRQKLLLPAMTSWLFVCNVYSKITTVKIIMP